jgi:H(+)-translocating pyrophosphatase
MGADLFGSLAESTCAALVVSTSSVILLQTPDAIYFPLLVTSTGIIASFITIPFAYIINGSVETKLKFQLIISTIVMSLLLIPLINYVLPQGSLDFTFAETLYPTTSWQVYGCIMLGLWSGLFIGLITEVFTSKSYRWTRELAEACLYDASTNIIKGLALGYMSNVIPIFCLAATVLFAFKWAAMYGVALAAIGMLGCLPIALTIDGYGPISDNAGGIAEMSNLDRNVRKLTDELDAAGNTTAAIGKGFAIGSACLVALALFGAFITRTAESLNDPTVYSVNILEPYTFAGLLVGAMLPYWFSALTMSAVGDAAQDMITEIMRQVPLIKQGAEPDHERCVGISTEAALQRMIAPGALVIISPLLAGWFFGYAATSGVLAGNIVSGIQIAFSASNSGGAWDNAKKYIEGGNLKRIDKDGQETVCRKGSKEHAAAVVGDTVGDPLKDTSGPSINILIKLSAITSLVFGGFIATRGGLLI